MFSFLSLIAGMLTVASPCVLPILPVILGRCSGGKQRNLLFMLLGLGFSLTLITLLMTSPRFLAPELLDFYGNIIAATLLILVGTVMTFQDSWERVMFQLGFKAWGDRLLSKVSGDSNFSADLITGFALGPAFSSCSPTYLIIVATILPQGFFEGFFYFLIFLTSFLFTLYFISGSLLKLVAKQAWVRDFKHPLRRALSFTLILIGLALITHFDKTLERYLVEYGSYQIRLENHLKTLLNL
jgi:cytochrome c-type biogenesis protein